MEPTKFDIIVYEKKLRIIRENDRWRVVIKGTGGINRPAHDIVIPPDVKKDEIQVYLEDLLHEHADLNRRDTS